MGSMLPYIAYMDPMGYSLASLAGSRTPLSPHPLPQALPAAAVAQGSAWPRDQEPRVGCAGSLVTPKSRLEMDVHYDP